MQIEEDGISITLHAPYSNRAHGAIWLLALVRLPVDRRCHGTQTVHQLADTDHISQIPLYPPPVTPHRRCCRAAWMTCESVLKPEWWQVAPLRSAPWKRGRDTLTFEPGHSIIKAYKSRGKRWTESHGEKNIDKMWKAWWEIMTGYEDLSPPFICRHKHSIYHSASAQTALRKCSALMLLNR